MIIMSMLSVFRSRQPLKITSEVILFSAVFVIYFMRRRRLRWAKMSDDEAMNSGLFNKTILAKSDNSISISAWLPFQSSSGR